MISVANEWNEFRSTQTKLPENQLRMSDESMILADLETTSYCLGTEPRFCMPPAKKGMVEIRPLFPLDGLPSEKLSIEWVGGRPPKPIRKFARDFSAASQCWGGGRPAPGSIREWGGLLAGLTGWTTWWSSSNRRPISSSCQCHPVATEGLPSTSIDSSNPQPSSFTASSAERSPRDPQVRATQARHS